MAQVGRGKKEPGVSWEGDVERLGPTMEVQRNHSNMKLEELKTQTTISPSGVLATEIWEPIEGKALLMRWADNRAPWKPRLRRMEEADGLRLS